MNWTLNTKPITTISDFPDKTFGFVYHIKHIPSGKSYIGKKVLFHNRKQKITKKQLKEYLTILNVC